MELQTLGKFRLIRPLGGRSSVFHLYLARHEDEPETAAPAYVVKMLPSGAGPEHAALAAQFEHEVRLYRSFNHPGIPSLHGEGTESGVRFLVIDYIDGCDLATLLGHDEGGARGLSKEIAVYLMGQLADALHHVHTAESVDERGRPVELAAVHRDICPANVLLSRTGQVLLADYNSATSVWLAKQSDMSQAGSKAYMAPERVVGTSPASIQSDLFALAVILWEMLKGQRCFKADDDLRTIDAIVRFDISHPSRRVSGLSAKLSEIVRKNLDRDPARRYSGAYQILQRLAQSPEAAAAERSRDELGALVAEAADRRLGRAR